MAEQQQNTKSDVKEVLVVEENNGKSYWHNVGVAFVNKDGSLTVKLHLFPSLRLHIREKRHRQDAARG